MQVVYKSTELLYTYFFAMELFTLRWFYAIILN